MAFRDNLRFRCYLLSGGNIEADLLTRAKYLDDTSPYFPFSYAGRQFDRLKRHLSDPQERHFILWDDLEKKIIGRTQLLLRPEIPPRFTGSRISLKMQRRGLANLLYDSRVRCLQEEGYYGSTMAVINKTNEKSLEAAENNGFVIVNPNTSQPTYDLKRHIDPISHNPLLESARQSILEEARPRVESW